MRSAGSGGAGRPASFTARRLALLLPLALGACAPDEPKPPPPPVGGTGGLSAGPGGGVGPGATDTGTAGSTDTGTAGGSSGSGTAGGAYGPCPDGTCPEGEVCVESAASPGARICAETCLLDEDCPAPASGSAAPLCVPGDLLPDTVCRLDCSSGQACPEGATCDGLWCAYPP
ncbi:MAG: hypothetical protein D6705_08125 [Deltaproteobacteria bacterium]|nr:MAG: hypothetical protein D6705_08125 [Deltaproteobacteria bacterium]